MKTSLPLVLLLFAALAYAQTTTLGPIPQPTFVTIMDRVPAKDLVTVELVDPSNPLEGFRAHQIVVPADRWFVITNLFRSGGPASLSFDGVNVPNISVLASQSPDGVPVHPGTVITAPGSAFVYGYFEDRPN